MDNGNNDTITDFYTRPYTVEGVKLVRFGGIVTADHQLRVVADHFAALADKFEIERQIASDTERLRVWGTGGNDGS